MLRDSGEKRPRVSCEWLNRWVKLDEEEQAINQEDDELRGTALRINTKTGHGSATIVGATIPTDLLGKPHSANSRTNEVVGWVVGHIARNMRTHNPCLLDRCGREGRDDKHALDVW
jgi:hypothetical protein